LRADLGRDAANLAVYHVTFARVQSGTHIHSQPRGIFADRDGAANRARRPVKDCQRAIANHVYVAASEPLDLFADVHLQPIDERFPVTLARGVRVLSAKTVTIENCTIAGQGVGVEVLTTNSTNVALVNTTIKNCTTAGLRVETSAGIARATVRNSVFTNCGTGIVARRNSRVAMEESTIAFNAVGVLVEGNGATAIAFLKNCHINNNTGHGIQAGSGLATTTSVARISHNLINNNAGAGLSIQANGAVETFVNNEINGNNPDGCAGCVNVTATVN